MAREVTATPVPHAPPLAGALGQLALVGGVLVVLCVVPPCASSRAVDVSGLLALGTWAAWRLMRLLLRPRWGARVMVVPPRAAPPPAEVVEAPADPT
jgi:hypothetical protein